MLLRLLTYVGLGIDAVVRGEWLVAVLCFMTPCGGPLRMATAFVAGVTFVVFGQYVEGAIAIGILVYNLVGNQIMKKTIEKSLIRSFETGLRLIQVSLYATLHSQYSATMPEDPASVLAAQVVNYLKGEDIVAVIDNTPEPLKSNIARIKDQVPETAAKAMAESRSTREVIVGTLRMRELMKFMVDGESYLRSDEHQRIYKLLAPYGPEFPDEIKPDTYLEMAHRYHQEQFGASSLG